MKNIFQSVRALFGQNATTIEWQPIDELQKAINDQKVAQFELNKAVEGYDHINGEYTLKLKACDVLIEKGEKIGEQNKKFLTQRLDGITDNFLDNTKQLSKALEQAEQKRIELESDIIAKAIRVTAQLDPQDQSTIKDMIDVWQETGLIKGEQVDSQAKAITIAIEEIVKGGEGSRGGKIIGHTKSGKPVYAKKRASTYKSFTKEDHRNAAELHLKANTKGGFQSEYSSYHHSEQADDHIEMYDTLDEIKKSHEPIAIENAGKGDIEYDSPVQGHYANVIIKDKDGKILFLKRASNKKVEPNKYCLPGGHIDEGETIEQAACRELKEEANIDCDSCYIIGKAKCEDGKWAFYLGAYPQYNTVMLLDGESVNAHWMSRDEWIEADLFFDLKDHLLAIENDGKPGEIKNIMKGEKEVEMSWKDFKKEHKRLLDILENGTQEERRAEAARQRKEYNEYDEEINKGEDDEELQKAMFHPEKPNHKYIRREGSPGNYTYLYDSPDMKSRDGKSHREGLYSSNVAPKSDKEPTHQKGERIKFKTLDGKKKEGYFLQIDKEGNYVIETDSDNYSHVPQKYILFDDRKFNIPDVFKKAESDDELEKAIDDDNPFYYDNQDELIKGRAAAEGEERTWGGKKYKKSGKVWKLVGEGKEGNKKYSDDEIEEHFHEGYSYTNNKHKGYDVGKKSEQWSEHHEAGSKAAKEHHKRDITDMPASAFGKYQEKLTDKHNKQVNKDSKKHSTDHLTKHAENTSSDQLKKVAAKKDHPHNDAAKRELERRGGDEGSIKEKRKALNDFRKEISKVLEENDYDTDNPKVQKVLDKYMEMDTNAFDSDDLNDIIDKEIANNKGEEEKSHKVMKKMVSTDFDHSSPHETMAIAKKAYTKGIPHKHIESFITKIHGSEEGEDKEWDAKAAKFAKSIIKKLPKE